MMLKPNRRQKSPKPTQATRPGIYLRVADRAKMDKLCKRLGYNRSELIRLLVEQEYEVQFPGQ